jgi:hypothetical protein
MAENLFKPSSRGIRDPLTNEQVNGRVVNPPRFPELGGFKNKSKGFKKNSIGIVKPGPSVK